MQYVTSIFSVSCPSFFSSMPHPTVRQPFLPVHFPRVAPGYPWDSHFWLSGLCLERGVPVLVRAAAGQPCGFFRPSSKLRCPRESPPHLGGALKPPLQTNAHLI